MNKIRAVLALPALYAVLAFVATLNTVSPNCIGWFYEPKKPERYQ